MQILVYRTVVLLILVDMPPTATYNIPQANWYLYAHASVLPKARKIVQGTTVH